MDGPGTDRANAEVLARKLAAKEQQRAAAARSLTFGAHPTNQWLPAKKLHLATSFQAGWSGASSYGAPLAALPFGSVPMTAASAAPSRLTRA